VAVAREQMSVGIPARRSEYYIRILSIHTTLMFTCYF